MFRKFTRALITIPLSAALLLSLGACTSSISQPEQPAAPTAPTSSATTQPAKEAQPVTFTVVGTGDVLSHMPVVNHSKQPDGTYDYAPLVKSIRPYIAGANLALCHQELPYTYDDSRISGYPVFHAPKGWAHSSKELGYDGCSLASNHTWDDGRRGIHDTIEMIDNQGMGTSGAAYSPDALPYQLYVVTVDNRPIKVAHLSFTFGTNFGYPDAVKEDPYLMNINNPKRMIEEAKDAREHGAQVVIVSAHGGDEYGEYASSQQKEWARMFAESGVIDLYLGHHVHVVQPIDKIETGGPDGKGMWVIYGTGNLVSNMGEDQGIGTQTGIIAQATITVPPSGPAHVDDVKWVGLVLDRSTTSIYLANGYHQADHPGSGLSDSDATRYYNNIKKVIGDKATELTEAPTQDAAPVEVIPRMPQPLREPGRMLPSIY